MSVNEYPPMGEETAFTLELIAERLAEDPHFMRQDDCPYPIAVVDLLSPPERDLGVEAMDEMEEVDLVRETTTLFKELQDAKENFQVNDHSERMSYFRTSTSLLEKLVAMKERALNVRQVSHFYSTVLDAMEQVLEPGQVTEVRERLKEYLA